MSFQFTSPAFHGRLSKWSALDLISMLLSKKLICDASRNRYHSGFKFLIMVVLKNSMKWKDF
jgi:hypothetical protein